MSGPVAVAKAPAAKPAAAAVRGRSATGPAASCSGLLQAAPRCTCASSGGASCPRCNGRTLQAKLRIGAHDDPLERQADLAAEAALAPAMSAADGGRALLQRDAAANAAGLHSAPDSVEQTLSAPGAALPAAVRRDFETRFGHDFSRVRVHADAAAAASAEAVGARAYTVGRHLVFAAGEFAPASALGRRLLAHELAHVVQQGEAAPVLRRWPVAATPFKARILSLSEVQAEPEREKKRVQSGQTEARVWRSIGAAASAANCPATLKPGSVVTVLEKKPGGLWLRIAAADVANVGPAEHVHVLAAFAKEVPPEVKPSPPPPRQEAPSQPAATAAPQPQAEPPSRLSRLRERIGGMPKKFHYKGPPGRTTLAIQMCTAAMSFWFDEPQNRDYATTLVTMVWKNYSEKFLTDSAFNKRFREEKGMNALATGPLFELLKAGRSSIKRLRELTIPGVGMGEAVWEDELGRLRGAHEVLEVVSGDQEVAQSRNIKMLDDMTQLRGPRAFFDGLIAGARSELEPADYERLAAKINQTAVLGAFSAPVIAAGAVVGIAKDVVDALKGIYELVTETEKIVSEMADLITLLMTDEEGSRALGEAIGVQEAQSLKKMSEENIVTFTYKLGEKVGPTVVYAVMSLMGVGAGAGATRLATFLRKFPKANKYITAIERLMPQKKKPLHAPDADKPPAPKTTPVEAGKAAPEAKKASPAAVDAKTELADYKYWAQKSLGLSQKTLDDLSPGALKKLKALPEKDLARIRGLSERARRALLRCASPCDVDGPDIARKLADFTDTELEVLAEEELIGKHIPKGKDRGGLEVPLTDKQHARIRRIADAINDDTKWGEVTHNDRFRLGKVYDNFLVKLMHAAYGSVAKTYHYIDMDAKFLSTLERKGRVLITEGRFASLKLRLDMLILDFDRNRAEVIDIAGASSSRHVEKTRKYKKAVKETFNLETTAVELLYADKNGKFLDEMIEKPVD